MSRPLRSAELACSQVTDGHRIRKSCGRLSELLCRAEPQEVYSSASDLLHEESVSRDEPRVMQSFESSWLQMGRHQIRRVQRGS